jgi:hypothetical protein
VHKDWAILVLASFKYKLGVEEFEFNCCIDDSASSATLINSRWLNSFS